MKSVLISTFHICAFLLFFFFGKNCEGGGGGGGLLATALQSRTIGFSQTDHFFPPTESTSSGNNTRETIPGKRDDTGDIGDHTTDVIVLAVALAAFVLVELIKLALDRTTVMALAVWSLAAALLIAVIALTVVLFLKRRKRRPQGDYAFLISNL